MLLANTTHQQPSVHLSHASYPRPCRIPHWTTQHSPSCTSLLACSLEQLLTYSSNSFSFLAQRVSIVAGIAGTAATSVYTVPSPSGPSISTSCLCSAAQSTPLHEPPASFAPLPQPPHVGSLAVLPASAILVTMAPSISMRSKKNSERALKLLGRRKNRQIVSP